MADGPVTPDLPPNAVIVEDHPYRLVVVRYAYPDRDGRTSVYELVTVYHGAAPVTQYMRSVNG